MKLEKKYWVIIAVIVVIALWYFFLRKKSKEESNFKWPRWLKVGGCRPCTGSTHDGCCGGCIC